MARNVHKSLFATLVIGLLIACSTEHISNRTQTESERMFISGHAYAFLRAAASPEAAIIMAIPVGTEVHAFKTDIVGSFLGRDSVWYRIPALNGFVFGGLLSSTPPSAGAVPYKLVLRQSIYHQYSVSTLSLASGQAQLKTTSEYSGPPYPPAIERTENGSFTIAAGSLRVSFPGRTLVLKWKRELAAYADFPAEFTPRIGRPFNIRFEGQRELECEHERALCQFSCRQKGIPITEASYSYYCPAP